MMLSCRPEAGVTIDKSRMEMAFPVLHTEMSVADMLKHTKDSMAVRVYPDNSISLVYEGNLVKRDVHDILGELPDTKTPVLAPQMDVPVTLLDSVQINEAQIKSGFLHFKFTIDTGTTDVTVTFEMPQILHNDTGLVHQVLLPASNGVPASVEDSIDLAGYSLDLSSHILHFEYTAVNGYGDTILLPIDLDIFHPQKNYVYISNIVFSYVEGHWDKVVHDFEPQVINIDFFENNFVNGEIYFADPRVEFTVINSFGLPVRTKVNYFRVVELDSNVVDMVSPPLTAGIDFGYPSLNEVGETKLTYFVFDKTNSNIDQILNTNPRRIEYDIDVTVNPDNLPNSIGFATDSSYFEMLAKAELPLKGTVNHFIFLKDFDVDFLDANVRDATLKLATDNGLPLEMRLQMFFLDAGGQVLDSLYDGTDELVLAAADYQATMPVHTEREFYIPPDRWARIRNATRIRLRGNYTTSQGGQQIVTIDTNQKTAIKLGLKLGL